MTTELERLKAENAAMKRVVAEYALEDEVQEALAAIKVPTAPVVLGAGDGELSGSLQEQIAAAEAEGNWTLAGALKVQLVRGDRPNEPDAPRRRPFEELDGPQLAGAIAEAEEAGDWSRASALKVETVRRTFAL